MQKLILIVLPALIYAGASNDTGSQHYHFTVPVTYYNGETENKKIQWPETVLDTKGYCRVETGATIFIHREEFPETRAVYDMKECLKDSRSNMWFNRYDDKQEIVSQKNIDSTLRYLHFLQQKKQNNNDLATILQIKLGASARLKDSVAVPMTSEERKNLEFGRAIATDQLEQEFEAWSKILECVQGEFKRRQGVFEHSSIRVERFRVGEAFPEPFNAPVRSPSDFDPYRIKFTDMNGSLQANSFYPDLPPFPIHVFPQNFQPGDLPLYFDFKEDTYRFYMNISMNINAWNQGLYQYEYKCMETGHTILYTVNENDPENKCEISHIGIDYDNENNETSLKPEDINVLSIARPAPKDYNPLD